MNHRGEGIPAWNYVGRIYVFSSILKLDMLPTAATQPPISSTPTICW